MTIPFRKVFARLGVIAMAVFTLLPASSSFSQDDPNVPNEQMQAVLDQLAAF